MGDDCRPTLPARRSAREVRFIALFATGAALALSGCGGGGGGGGDAPPSPSPTPSPILDPLLEIPSPVVRTPVVPIRTAEYDNSTYLDGIQADGAYLLGATGNGVNIAIIDDGISETSPELSGRVRDYIDTTGSYPSGGLADHGTSVASIAAAVRDGAGVHGVAFNSYLYDINVFTKSATGDVSATDADIGEALNIVAGNNPSYSSVNARIANMSLAGDGGFSSSTLAAMRSVAAADRIMVISAGNDGNAQPAPTALAVTDPGIGPSMLIVGAVDDANTIASFSNRAGSYGDYFVVAPGVRLITAAKDGGYVFFSGTSAATPVVSGALAVLANAYPFLTGPQLVALIKQTADDLGAPGVDAVYGSGLVNLTTAMNPVAPLVMTVGNTVDAVTAPLSGATVATGSVLGGFKGGHTILLDAYRRAYTVPLDTFVTRQASLFDSFTGVDGRASGAGIGALLDNWYPEKGASLAFGSGVAARHVSAAYAVALSGNTFAMSMRHAGVASLVAMPELEPAAGNGRSLFLSTSSAATPQGAFMGDGVSGVALGWRNDGLRMTASYAAGRNIRGRSDLMQSSMAVKIGPVEWGLSGSMLNEDGSLLGAFGQGVFAGAGGRTGFATASLRYDAGADWTLAATYTRARLTEGTLGNGLGLRNVDGSAMSFTLSGPAGWREGDRLGFRMAQPLRADKATANIWLPVGRDIAGNIIRRHQAVGMEPDGRELDFELAYATPLPEFVWGRAAFLTLNGFAALQPGHVAEADPAYGMAAQFTFRW
ncbi:S8 family peptidase [Parvibaculum sp. MBR-TMA-1.3b-4.2]|jgi:hypothetical protein